MAENEIEVGGKFGLPSFGGFALELGGHYRRAWSSRGTALARAVADQAGLETEELGQRLAEDEPLRDVFWMALNRAVQVSDPDYVSALGRLVGQALDPARIDELAFMTAELVQLEPLHLRLLIATFRFTVNGHETQDPLSADKAYTLESEARLRKNATVADKLDVSVLAAQRACRRMVADQYLGWYHDSVGETLHAGDWGANALLFLFPNMLEVDLGGDTPLRQPPAEMPSRNG